jgi:hypothetical protein
MDDILVQLYQKMADLTEPECGKCRVPYSCCSLDYCAIALTNALEDGVQLHTPGYRSIPLLSATGCICPPQYRPLCTLHTCDINGYGFKPGDPKWTRTYFKLRIEIDREEEKKYDSERSDHLSGIE